MKKYLVLFLSLLLLTTTVNAEEIIVNKQVTRDNIPQSTLRAIFGMRIRNWPNNDPITVFILKDRNQHEKFVKNMLGIPYHQLQRSLDIILFSGIGQAPITVSSMDEMKDKIYDTAGAIGYVPCGQADRSSRVLTINHKPSCN